MAGSEAAALIGDRPPTSRQELEVAGVTFATAEERRRRSGGGGDGGILFIFLLPAFLLLLLLKLQINVHYKKAAFRAADGEHEVVQ